MSQTPDYMALTHAHAEATFARVAAGQVNGYDAMAVLIADTLGLSAEDYVPAAGRGAAGGRDHVGQQPLPLTTGRGCAGSRSHPRRSRRGDRVISCQGRTSNAAGCPAPLFTAFQPGCCRMRASTTPGPRPGPPHPGAAATRPPQATVRSGPRISPAPRYEPPLESSRPRVCAPGCHHRLVPTMIRNPQVIKEHRQSLLSELQDLDRLAGERALNPSEQGRWDRLQAEIRNVDRDLADVETEQARYDRVAESRARSGFAVTGPNTGTWDLTARTESPDGIRKRAQRLIESSSDLTDTAREALAEVVNDRDPNAAAMVLARANPSYYNAFEKLLANPERAFFTMSPRTGSGARCRIGACRNGHQHRHRRMADPAEPRPRGGADQRRGNQPD